MFLYLVAAEDIRVGGFRRAQVCCVEIAVLVQRLGKAQHNTVAAAAAQPPLAPASDVLPEVQHCFSLGCCQLPYWLQLFYDSHGHTLLRDNLSRDIFSDNGVALRLFELSSRLVPSFLP